MAAVVNDRDVLIMATVPRYTVANDRGLFVAPSAGIFSVNTDGTASPASFTFQATALNLPGTIKWSFTDGMAPTISGTSVTLDYEDFSAVSGTITVSITVDGQTYTQIATVTKIAAEGAEGPQGMRGNIDIAKLTANHVWSDAEAVAAIAADGYGKPQNRDLVRLYNSDKTFSVQKEYDGAQWVAVSYVYDGSVFLKGSILPESIDTRGMDIKDAAGNVTFAANTPLVQQVRSNPNLAPTPNGFNFINGVSAGRNGDTRFGDGQYLWIPPTADSSFIGGLSPALNIPAGATYTVSFDAYCTDLSTPRTLIVDVYGTNNDNSYYDSAGVNGGAGVVVTGLQTKYKFTETMSSNARGDAYLRIFTAAPGGNNVIVVANIKVELGSQVTPWEDSVITAANLTTYIKGALIGLAQINTASIGSLSALSAIIGTLQTSASGQRSQVSDSGFQYFNPANLPVIQIGNF